MKATKQKVTAEYCGLIVEVLQQLTEMSLVKYENNVFVVENHDLRFEKLAACA